jgi:RNA polymerase-binding transcription factor DksA
MYTPEFIEKMKQQLLEEKTKLEAGLEGTSSFPEYDTQSSDDVAEKIEADATNQDAVSDLKAELDKVNAALARIADGTYGQTPDGSYISEARLEAFPAAEDSVENAE